VVADVVEDRAVLAVDERAFGHAAAPCLVFWMGAGPGCCGRLSDSDEQLRQIREGGPGIAVPLTALHLSCDRRLVGGEQRIHLARLRRGRTEPLYLLRKALPQ
jgi:hypothetical protein